MIWDMVLVEERRIIVTAEANRAPGLLEVNRQIRQETLEIYYSRNTFLIRIVDHDAVPIIPARERFLLYDKSPKTLPNNKFRISYIVSGHCDWSILQAWVKAEFNLKSAGTTGPEWYSTLRRNRFSKNTRGLRGLFAIIHALKKSQVAWEVVEGMFPGFQAVVSAVDDECGWNPPRLRNTDVLDDRIGSQRQMARCCKCSVGMTWNGSLHHVEIG
jgi:hypothetical protein